MVNLNEARTLGANLLKRVLGAEDSKSLTRAFLEIGAVIGVSLISTTAIAQPFYVPSGSMQPTLAIGDAFVAAKYPYGYSRYSVPLSIGPSSPERLLQRMPQIGDVVVFRLPRNPNETLVKRVVGLPGDRVQMVDGHLRINGKQLPLRADGEGQVESEDGISMTTARFVETLPNGRTHPIFKWTWDGALDNTPVFTVPAGHIFMMGDNRDNSLDSRVPAQEGGVGFVPVENLVGRAEFVVGSYDFLNARAVTAWFTSLRPSRFFNSVN